MQINSIGFIGGGRITQILLKSLSQKDSLPGKVLVADPNEDVKPVLTEIDSQKIQYTKNNRDVLDVDLLCLAIHPPVMKEISAEIKNAIDQDTIAISFLPVITIDKLSGLLGIDTKLVRMIPNAASILHKGYNPVAYGEAINENEKQELTTLFTVWGEAPEVDEEKLEAYAIITAMGPTYLWFQWLQLQELGREFGLTDTELKEAMPSMLHGATETLFESTLQSDEVLDLIPVCPMKEHESEIENMYQTKLHGLYAKLTGK